jgi:2-polyprenyl-6-methoxyphenol hydroxylase-like FAD-dependent oxidoreductase
MKIAIIGGGPSGLYFARLMKRRDPRHEIVVVEQNPEGATYGFGVAMGDKALDRLRGADAELAERIAAAMMFEHRQDIRLDNECVRLAYSDRGGAIERLKLLSILTESCREVGIAVEHNTRIEAFERFQRWDLIVAADGANSAVRKLHAAEFGTHSYNVTNYLAWYGLGRPLIPNGLSFHRYRGGYYVGHFYAYTATMSTFVTECDAQTWRDSGLEAMTELERRAHMERVFEPELQGSPLIDNKSNFRNLPVTTNERWAWRNIVLLGDALRSAHPSIGSGTRLAMDDAEALFQAFCDKGNDVSAALARFVEIRKPVRERFGVAMERSFMWYERLRTVMEQPILDFTYDFLMRTGRVDDERLAVYAPDFYREYQAYRAARTGAPPDRRVSSGAR